MTAFALSAAVRMALAGTMAVSGDVSSITTVPISLTLGTSTPEQIGVRATWNTTRTAGTLVRLQYKLPASATWTDGPWLSEFLASEVLAINSSAPGSGGAGAESGLSVVDGFGGFAYHLVPGVTYDVRLAVFVPAAATAYTAAQSYTTRALPAVLPAANKTCTPATLTASLAGLVAGDHLQLQAGTYPPFTVSASGTSGSPIYLSCAAGASVVYATADKIITVNGSDIVFDAMTITGTGVDSERAFMLAGGSMAGVYSTAFYSASVATQRVTVRNSTITGVDIFAKLWAQSDQWLVYNNTITGNNLHDVQYTIPPGDTYPRSGWNDTCINWHGLGNCAWNNTIQGFGDTVKFGFSTAPNGFECRWNHFYRNKVLRASDDGIEFENSNSGSAYRNYFANVGTLASHDGSFEGPFDVFENVCVNAGYGPLKMNSGSVNARFFHNTFVLTVKHGADHGLLTTNVANHYRTKFQNNVVVYRGAGNMVHWSAPLLSSPLFDHNAWYSATDDFFISTPTYGSAGNLAAAKTTFAPFMVGDVNTTTNPFTATITLGANAQSEYTAGAFDVTLVGGAAPLNAGVALPGFNDGYTGAAPTMGAVWGGQSSFIVGEGIPLPSYVPSPGHIAVLSTSNGLLTNSFASTVDSTLHYPFYAAKSVNDYSGAIINPHYGTYGALLTFGGGHAGTNYNGMHALVFGASSATFARVTEATDLGLGLGPNDTYSSESIIDYPHAEMVIDGKPVARHSYGSMDVIGPADGGAAYGTFMQVLVDSGTYIGTASGEMPHKVDFTSTSGIKAFARTGTPRNVGRLTDLPGNLTAPPQWTQHVPAQGRIYIEAHGATSPAAPHWYDLSTGTYVTGTGTSLAKDGGNDGGTMFHVASRDLLIFMDSFGGNLRIFTLPVGVSDTDPSWSSARTLSASIPVTTSWSTACWCVDNGRIIVGDVNGDANCVYEITIPGTLSSTWTCTRVGFTGGETISWMPSATYKKWAYHPALKGIPFLPRVTDGTTADVLYLYRPTGT